MQRQAFAGHDLEQAVLPLRRVAQWLQRRPGAAAAAAERTHGRNRDWRHLNNADIISMPDKWEYPWYAAWDLAFHCVPLALIDPEFAKEQLVLLTREWYMHPNGQLPAYEWASATSTRRSTPGRPGASSRSTASSAAARGDLAFLERVFHKLLLNFTWWVNRKDAEGRNIFQGGFLGLDNIGVFDRSAPLPTGGFINQADGTGWMAMYCLNLMRIALELALHNHVYEDIATKFFEHFLHIAEAMTNIGGAGHRPVGRGGRVLLRRAATCPTAAMRAAKVRSMVGLIPLFAVETLEPELLEQLPEFARAAGVVPELPAGPGRAGLALGRAGHGRAPAALAAARPPHEAPAQAHARRDRVPLRLRRARALALPPATIPTCFDADGHALHGRATSRASRTSGLFGGNSNWRGPIWFPVNYLIIESLQKFHHYYGDDFKVECPTGSGSCLTLDEVADELARRLTRLFLRDDRTAGGRCSATTRSCRPTRTSATTSCSTSTSTATPAAASAPRTRPAGPAWSPSCLAARAH